MLALEIEYLTGNVIASSSNDETQLDWPPQPDRIFSALVASWGARGASADERGALEWLERQNPPRIIASEVAARNAPTVFVPPNDFKTSNNGRFDVLPSRRQRQARYFPTGRPHESFVKIVWPENPEPGVRDTLDALARDTSYVGHSSSLTRCRFVEEDCDLSTSLAPKRTVYEGRLAELERLYHAGRRPDPGEVVVSAPRVPPQTEHRSVFSDDWIVLGDDGGRGADLRAAPRVAKALRDALMGAYQRVHESRPPEWLSGHGADGKPSASPHAAFVPLADVGWTYSEGRLMGFGIVLPRAIPPEVLFGVVGGLMEKREDNHRNIELHYGGSTPWMLVPLGVTEVKASLLPTRWTKPGRLWATATPIVLDRYPKKREPEARAREVAEQIANACVNIGLPRPSYVGTDLNSVVRGAPAACVAADAPAWQRWQVPRSVQGRYMTHAVLGFDEPVRGPMILGAGRYVGLGLCKPVEPGTTA